MLPASRYNEARRNAAFHVQVELIEIPADIKTPGNVKVNAQVQTIFRARPTLAIGDQVVFGVDVTRSSDNPSHIPIGGQIWTDYDKLRTARFMEVFLNGDPPECKVALWQSELIERPTTKPVMK